MNWFAACICAVCLFGAALVFGAPRHAEKPDRVSEKEFYAECVRVGFNPMQCAFFRNGVPRKPVLDVVP
jgi:hypothetical protein